MSAIGKLLGRRVGPVVGRYVGEYLAENSSARARSTIRTWLGRRLRGLAFTYEGRYYRGMLGILEALERRGYVERLPSARGGEAWVWSLCADCAHGRHEMPRTEPCACPCHGEEASHVDAGR